MTQDNLITEPMTEIVNFVPRRCPSCGSWAQLWRIMISGKPHFQVRCFNNPYQYSSGYWNPRCQFDPILFEPIADSQGAVRAWKLAVKMME